MSAATVSGSNGGAFEPVGERGSCPLARECPYVFADSICLQRPWGGSCENTVVMMAMGVNDDGRREVIGAAEGFTESTECRKDFLSWLKARGLAGVRMLVGDKAAAMAGTIAEALSAAACQCCSVHFYRNVLSRVPSSKRGKVAVVSRTLV